MKGWIALGLLVVLGVAGTASAQTPTPADVMAAAVRLKQAHVRRTWKRCRLGANEARCKKLLRLLHVQELDVLGKLQRTLNDNPVINRRRFSKEADACYAGGGDYGDLIRCWNRLYERVNAALSGATLASKP